MSTRFHAIVIGTGQSGPALAHALAGEGQNVAIIERKDFGGSCVNFGCIPTKTWVASARVAHVARVAADYGVNVGEVKVDMKRVKARKDELVEQSSSGVEKSLRENERITVVHGHARFVGPKQVRVNNETLSADKVIINVGTRANIPPIEGIEDVGYLTASDMLDLDELPGHLAVIGGGYVGMEFAQMFRRFGANVTVIQRGDRLIEREDPDVSETLREILESEGVNVMTGAEPARVRKEGAGVAIELKDGTGVEATHLLIATGRTPNTDTLGADEAGLHLSKRGFIQVDNKLETNQQGVFALGDCNGQGAFTHTSYNDFEILRDHLLGENRRTLDDRIEAHAVYTDPPIARVGMTETEARKRNGGTLIGRLAMDKVGRAKEMGETAGFMKVLVDKESGLILGAMVFGINGDEVIHSLLDVMYAKQPYTVIRDAVHIHPTVSELVPTMLENLEPLE